jgi:hypothetical protein
MADPKSVELFDRAVKVIPGGVNSPVRAFRAVGGSPVFVSRAEGAGSTAPTAQSTWTTWARGVPMIVGHAHPEVLAAVREVVSEAASLSARPPSSRCASPRRSARLYPSIEKVRCVSSGTEATMSAHPRRSWLHQARRDREVRGLLPRPRRSPAREGGQRPGHVRRARLGRRARGHREEHAHLPFNDTARSIAAFARARHRDRRGHRGARGRQHGLRAARAWVPRGDHCALQAARRGLDLRRGDDGLPPREAAARRSASACGPT